MTAETCRDHESETKLSKIHRSFLRYTAKLVLNNND